MPNGRAGTGGKKSASAGGKSGPANGSAGGNGGGRESSSYAGPAYDKNVKSKEASAAEGSKKVSEAQNRNTDTGRALASSKSDTATRYGVGALSSAGSQAQRAAMAGQANDINAGDGVGGFMSALGLRERFDLANAANTKAPDLRASWGFDPSAAIGTALGGALGIPALGFVANKVSALTGRPMEMNLGPDVFGANPTTGSSLGGHTTGLGFSSDPSTGPASTPGQQAPADRNGNAAQAPFNTGALSLANQVKPQPTPQPTAAAQPALNSYKPPNFPGFDGGQFGWLYPKAA